MTDKKYEGRAYSTENFPDEKAVHTQILQIPRNIHLEILALVEDGQFISIAEFYRLAARWYLDKIEKEGK